MTLIFRPSCDGLEGPLSLGTFEKRLSPLVGHQSVKASGGRRGGGLGDVWARDWVRFPGRARQPLCTNGQLRVIRRIGPVLLFFFSFCVPKHNLPRKPTFGNPPDSSFCEP